MDDIHGLKPYMYFAPNGRLLLLAGLAIVLVGLVAGYLLRTRKPRERVANVVIPEGPPRSAKVQLDALAASGLGEAGRVRDFHATLSAIIRGYLGVRFELPGRRLTTTELLGALAHRKIADEPYQMVADFLPRCDLAKFAEIRPGQVEMNALLATAYRLVDMLGDTVTPAEEAEESYA